MDWFIISDNCLFFSYSISTFRFVLFLKKSLHFFFWDLPSVHTCCLLTWAKFFKFIVILKCLSASFSTWVIYVGLLFFFFFALYYGPIFISYVWLFKCMPDLLYLRTVEMEVNLISLQKEECLLSFQAIRVGPESVSFVV